MPINRPRRIFRPSCPRLQIGAVVLLFGASLATAAGIAVATRSRPAVAPATLGGELRAEPEQVAVIDGGTLRLGNSIVRLQGVDAPSHSTECSGEDCGAAAANALASMVRDVPVACRVVGGDGSGRPYGDCEAGGIELNLAIVAAGWARAQGDVPTLKAAELAARNEKRGVWALNPAW